MEGSWVCFILDSRRKRVVKTDTLQEKRIILVLY